MEKGRERNPERTRQRLLEAASGEIHRHGFQAASLERILATAGVTKGALYHHFPGKLELGYAVVDELLSSVIEEEIRRPLAAVHSDAIGALKAHFLGHVARASQQAILLGCPVNNLAQEMSPIDEGFRRRIEEVFARWRDGLAAALRGGQARGEVRPEVDPERMAVFLLAVFEGSVGLAKSAGSAELFADNMHLLLGFLDTLRPTGDPDEEGRSGSRSGDGASPRRRRVGVPP